MKSVTSSQPQQTIVAHDTLQELSYAKRPAFDALWQPKDIVSIEVKPIERRHILGDKYLENIIKERPRTYMTPNVSLDDIEDKDKRKLLIDFTYKTITQQAADEVWGDFEVENLCSLQRHMEKQEKLLSDQRPISHLPARFLGAAREWDRMQIRSFYDEEKVPKDIMPKLDRPDTDKKMSEKEQVIRKLICEDKLSIIYDKLPLSYTGYKPYMACGVPLEKKRNLSIT